MEVNYNFPLWGALVTISLNYVVVASHFFPKLQNKEMSCLQLLLISTPSHGVNSYTIFENFSHLQCCFHDCFTFKMQLGVYLESVYLAKTKNFLLKIL